MPERRLSKWYMPTQCTTGEPPPEPSSVSQFGQDHRCNGESPRTRPAKPDCRLEPVGRPTRSPHSETARGGVLKNTMTAELIALTVQAAVLKKLRGQPWLRGVGSSVEGSKPIVSVLVKEITPEVLEAIPSKVAEVQVRLVVVGDTVDQAE